MRDEAGADEKILAVPVDSVFSGYVHIHDIGQVSGHWLERIGHFFQHYKDLERGKWVKLEGWGDAEAARKVIADSVARYQALPDAEKPRF